MPNSNRGLLPAGYSDSEDEFAEWDAGGGGDGNNFGGEGPAAAAPTPSREHPREEWRNKAFGDAAGIRPFQVGLENLRDFNIILHFPCSLDRMSLSTRACTTASPTP